jgi:hypothetical protein
MEGTKMRFCFLISILSAINCATYFTPPTTTIYVESKPEKKNVEIRCIKFGKTSNTLLQTPGIVIIPSNANCVIAYQSGESEKTFPIEKSFNPATAGNMGSPGFLFFIVDYLTGYNLLPTADPIMIKDVK